MEIQIIFMGDKKYHLMGRRRFMDALSALGVSSATIATLSQEGLAKITDDLKNEIPVVSRYNHSYEDGLNQPPTVEPVHDTVPYSRWSKIQAAFDAAEKISTNINRNVNKEDESNHTDVLISFPNQDESEIIITPQWIIKEEKTKTDTGQIRTEKTSPSIPYSEFEQSTPSQVTGKFTQEGNDDSFEFEVVPEKVTDKKEAYFDDDYDPIPGGVATVMDRLLDKATLCYHVYDFDAENRRFLATGHQLEDGNLLEHYYDEIGTPIDDPEWKVVNDGAEDEGVASILDDVDIYPRMADYNGEYTDEAIGGIKSADWISANPGEIYTKLGRTTGKETATYDGVSIEGLFKFDTESDDGDSGGPYYTVEDGEIFIGAMHIGKRGGHPVARPLEYVQENLNVLV